MGQAWLLRTKGPGAGGGGSQESRARQQQSHVLRALGSHRGWCPGEGQSSRAGRGGSAGPQGPEPTPAPPHPPLGTQTGTRGSTSHLRKRNLGHGCPRLGFFCREIRSPPPPPDPVAAESGARGGGGGAKSQPLPAAAWAGSKIAEAQLPPPGPARPAGPAPLPRDHSILSARQHRKGPTRGWGHRGLGQDRLGACVVGQIPSWGTEQTRARAWGRFRGGGARESGCRDEELGEGRAGPPGSGNGESEGSEVQMYSAHGKQGPFGAPLCGGHLPDQA